MHDWHLNGQKKEEGQWANGKAHGVFEDWYPVGGKKAEQVFEDGELISAVVWKPDGQKCAISHVLDGEGVLVEYDGLGKEIVDSLNTLDIPVLMGAVLTIAFIFILINIFVDVIYSVLDPKVKLN